MAVAWLFPGQGSQCVGMARDILALSSAARDVFERASAALAGAWGGGGSLSRLILEGPDEVLTLTANAQPALVATSCAILAAIRETVPDLALPSFAAGHSLGEYSALVASDALTLEDGVRLVRARGLAMQEAVPAGTGAMSAIVKLERTHLEQLCTEAAQGEVISPANFNAPGQIVVAGHTGAVERLAELVATAKGRAIPLKVSAPFHCALMEPAARAVAGELARISVQPPRFPIVANFDARPNRDPARVGDLLVRQVTGTVRWDESIELMAAQGVTHALELGPGKVLAGLVKRIAKGIEVLSVCDAPSLGLVPAFLAEAQQHG
jgi:[acyl-carrier-protein] S-malonyltransferase